jgi:hypothetical protein
MQVTTSMLKMDFAKGTYIHSVLIVTYCIEVEHAKNRFQR